MLHFCHTKAWYKRSQKSMQFQPSITRVSIYTYEETSLGMKLSKRKRKKVVSLITVYTDEVY